MEQALQLLWSLRNDQLSIDDLSHKIQLSPKQVVRKLKKWEEEGWICYYAGKGRGHLSTIHWQKDVEHQLLILLKQAFEQKDFNMLAAIQMTYFSDGFQQKVATLLTEQLLLNTHSMDPMLTIPIYSKSLNLHPHHYIDTESGWVLSHIYSRLVTQQQDKFQGDIVHHWEQVEDCFIFYVRPFIYWHNGEKVKIEEIIQSITATFELEKYSYFYHKVIHIKKRTSTTFEVIYNGKEEELLTLFSQLDFSLQHPFEKDIGTGAYKILQNMKGVVQLTVNAQYHHAHALIANIQFVTIPSTLKRKLEWSMQQQYQRQVELSGIVSAYLNPYSRNWQRPEARLFMLGILKQFAQQIEQVDSLKISYAHENLPSLQNATREKLRIGYIVNQSKFVEALQAFLAQQRIEAEVLKLEFDDTTMHHLFEQVDVLMIGEYPVAAFILEQDKEHPLSMYVDNTWHTPLYTAFREIYYPSNFRRSDEIIYGYPNLTKCWVSESMLSEKPFNKQNLPVPK